MTPLGNCCGKRRVISASDCEYQRQNKPDDTSREDPARGRSAKRPMTSSLRLRSLTCNARPPLHLRSIYRHNVRVEYRRVPVLQRKSQGCELADGSVFHCQALNVSSSTSLSVSLPVSRNARSSASGWCTGLPAPHHAAQMFRYVDEADDSLSPNHAQPPPIPWRWRSGPYRRMRPQDTVVKKTHCNI